MKHVAVVGEVDERERLVATLVARDVGAVGVGAGEDFKHFDAVIVLLDRDREHAIAPPLGTPVIAVAEEISNEIVAAASALGAIDIVQRDDEGQIVDALLRARERLHWVSPLPEAFEGDVLRKVFDLTPNYVSIRDAQGCFILVSQSLADFYGTTVEELVGKPLETFVTPSEAAAELAEDREILATRRSKVVERDVVDRSGAKRRLQIIKRPLAMLETKMHFVMTVGIDVTRRYRTENALENTNEFLKSVLESITDAVFALDLSGKFTLANHRLVELTGHAHPALLGSSFTKIFSNASMLDAKRNVSEAIGSGGAERRFEARIAHAEGHERIVSCSLMPLVRGGRTVGLVGTAEDVTERRLAERRIEHLAYHDPLTNLPNRRLLSDRLSVALSQASRDDRIVAVLFLDLDRFKAINDSLGHRTGDSLLQELGSRLRACVRAGDTVARMGGDEFVVVIPSLTDTAAAIAIADQILEAVRVPFAVDGRELVITGCIGMSIYPHHAIESEALVRQADVALFECKRRGRDGWRMYDASMSTRSYERFELENDLRRALRDDELRVYYQPIFDMRSGVAVGLEALVRWEHPVRGLLTPDLFIPIAEENGMIGRIGDWVLREAAQQNAAWQREGLPKVAVAVNVSAHQFDMPIVELVQSALDDAGLDPEYLALELTESILMQSAASPSHTIQELKSLGIRIAIDDFGTGYSSLSYLERFPIDVIKIDRSFMPGDTQVPQAGLIASAIISLAQSLGLHVVAEGVETHEQREFLIARGCAIAQGYLYSPAVPADQIGQLLRGNLGHRVLA